MNFPSGSCKKQRDAKGAVRINKVISVLNTLSLSNIFDTNDIGFIMFNKLKLNSVCKALKHKLEFE